MKFTKKITSVFMAIAMVITMLPLGAFTSFADEARDHYLFAYFTSNSTAGQKIRFAVSEDGLNYNALNKNKAIINQTVGTGCARDPYIFIGQDGKYYIIATDMDATGGWWDNSNTIAVFQSDDLINWNNQALFNMYDMYAQMGITYVEGTTTVHCTWAPQVIWDSSVNKYMIYFALADTEISQSGKQIMYYMYATDLMDTSTWERPQKLYQASQAAIDGDIMFNSSDNKYYMYYKDESQATICYCTADSLTGPYTYQGKAITSVSDALEGCNCFYRNGQLTMFCDAYNNGYFVAAESNDYQNWTVLNSSNYNIDQLSPRHGSVINITQSEYDALVAAYGTSSNDDFTYAFNNDVTQSGSNYQAYTDTGSGHTYDLQTYGNAISHADSNWLLLNDSVVFINDPAARSIIAGDEWTVSLDESIYTVKSNGTINCVMMGIRSGDNRPFYLLDNGDYYFYDSESGTTVKGGNTEIKTGVTYRFHVVYTGTSLMLYKNGTLVFTKPMPQLVSTANSPCYFGVGNCDLSNTNYINATVSNLRFRSSALTSSAISSEASINNNLVYRYNGGTDSVNNRDNVTYSGDSGIALPDRYEYNGDSREQSWTVSTWVNPGSSSGGENVLFMMGWDSYAHYLTILENGVIHYNFDGSYTDINATTFTANTWYFVQLNFIPRGDSFEINTYVNGNLVNTANSSGGSTSWTNMNVRNKLPDYFFNNNDSFPVTAGVGGAAHDHGGYWNTPGKGYIDDFRVYNRALDPTMLYTKMQQEYRAETAGDDDSAIEQASTIDDALAIFEARIARMANSGYDVMYTNINDAYTAYKAAVAAKNSGVAGAGELADLKTALTNMTIFTPYTGTNNPGNGSTFNPESGYYGNIIYSEGGTSGTHAYSDNACTEIYESHGIASRYGSWAYLYYPASVIMYDGEHDAVIPVMTGFRNKDGRYSVDVLALTEEMDDFGLKNGTWRTYGSYTSNDALDTSGGDSSTFQWPSGDFYAMPVTNTGDYMGDGYSMKTIQSGSNKENYYRTVKNGLVYTGTPTAAYTCYSQTSWNIRSHYTYISDHYINDTLTNGDPDIDIINYKKLIDALMAAANSTTNKGYLADLQEKYQSGGLEGLFKAYDSATTLDPNTGSTYFNHVYDYAGKGVYANESEPMDVAALQCGNDIDASVALLGNIKITTESANYDRLVAAIEEYETKMSNMKQTIYTNLTAAYKAYLLACEYRDAYEYGGRQTFENPTLSGAAEALENETDKMIAFDEMTWDGKGYFGTNLAVNGYENVLYSSKETQQSAKGNDKMWYKDYYMYMSKYVVLINDGVTTPAQPVEFGYKMSNNSAVLYYIGNNGTNYPFVLQTNWRGYRENSSYYYDLIGRGDSQDQYSCLNFSNGNFSNRSYEMEWWYCVPIQNSYPDGTNRFDTQSGGDANKNTPRYYYNKLYYVGTPDTTNYYTKYTSNLAGYYLDGSGKGIKGRQEQTDTMTSYNTTYVINYQPLREKLADIAKDINGIDVTNYQEGGLITWFTNLDKVANVNPNVFFTNMNDNNVATAVSDCATAIKNAIGESVTGNIPTGVEDVKTSGDVYNGDTLQPISENNGAYTNLKIALEEIKSAPTEQGCVKSDYWDDYNDKLAAAQLAMYVIANNTGKDENTNKDGYANTGGAYTEAQINALATNLHNAMEALYDIANSSHPLKFSYEEREDHTGYFQCYSNNSHILNKDTHETVVDADMTVYDELGIVYSTIDLTKYESPEGLKAAKTVYNRVKTEPGAPGATAQDIVDGGITALLEGITEADEYEGADNVSTYNVTFEVYKNDTKVATSVKTYDYGTAVTLDAASAYAELGDKVCTDWVVDSTRIVNRSNTFNLYVQRDVTVKAYFVELDPSVENAAEIRLATVTNYTMYQIAGTTASTIKIQSGENLNTIKIDGTDYTVPNTVVYEITGWKVGDHVLEAGDYTVADLMQYCYSSFLKIDPIVVAKHSSETDTYTVSLDGTELFTNVQYDTRKSVTSNVDNFYAIVVHDGDKFIPVSYSNTYDFYVIYNMEMYTLIKDGNEYKVTMGNNTITITDETMLFYLNHKLPFVYSFVSPDKDGKVIEGIYNKHVLNAAFTTNCNVEVTECGILFSTASINISDMTVDNVDSVATLYKRVNTKRDEKSNQYYYALKSSSHTGPVYLRGYVKYKYTYHDPINDEDVTIDAVAYSDMNTAFYNMADPNAQ